MSRKKPLGGSLETTPPTLHIYIRVSTVSQQTDGTSLKTQREVGEQRAKSLGFRSQLWDEGGKSSHHEDVAERPVFNSLYQAIKSGEVKHVFVYDQSRLSRNDVVASVFRHECRKQGVNIYTKDGSYDLTNPSDNLLTQVMNAVAEFDNSVRVDRSRRGKFQRALEGLWVYGHPPYGYTVVDRRLVVNQEEAKWVRFIFDKRASGVGVAQIKLALDAHYVKPKVRKTWCPTSIRGLIRNTHHIGHYTVTDPSTKEGVQVSCERIVSDEVWLRANEQIDEERSRRTNRNRAVTQHFLFRELTLCAHCGRRLTLFETQATRSAVYMCPMKQRQWAKLGKALYNKKRFKGCGFDRAVRATTFDQAVLSAIREAFENPQPYLERYACSVMSGHAIVTSHNQYLALKRRIRELRDSETSLDSDIAKFEQLDPVIDRELMGWGKPAYALRLRQKDIQREADYLEMVLEEREQYVAYKAWFENIKSQLSDLLTKSTEEQKSLLKQVLSVAEVRYQSATRSHAIRLQFINPLMPMRKIHIDRVPRSRRKFASVVRKADREHTPK
jgi:DNA invertase Pin-like site-specific DNA recombinase